VSLDIEDGLAAIGGRYVSGRFRKRDAGGEKFLIVRCSYLTNGSLPSRGCSCPNIVRTHLLPITV